MSDALRKDYTETGVRFADIETTTETEVVQYLDEALVDKSLTPEPSRDEVTTMSRARKISQDSQPKPLLYGQITDREIDERLFAGTKLVHDFSEVDVHTSVLQEDFHSSSKRIFNARVDRKGNTMHGVTSTVMKRLFPDVDKTEVDAELAEQEEMFTYLTDGQPVDDQEALVAKHDRTDLIRGLEAFRGAMTDHHGYIYDAFCRRTKRFGAFVIETEETGSI